MATIKVPVFGGLVTYADPEDLEAIYSPETSNFDISKAGVLRRREGSSLAGTFTDRGINSLYQWTHSKISGGSQWICYCNRRGIVWRSNGSLTQHLNTGHNGYTNMFGVGYQHELQSPLPEKISFTPLGEQVVLNMGVDQEPYMFHYVDHKYFNGLFSPLSGVYIDRFILPNLDYNITLTADTVSGELPGSSSTGYLYNIAPVYDGVNEYPMIEANEKDASLSATGKIKIDIELSMQHQSRRLTGLKVYRSLNDASAPKSYRQVKNINLLNFGNAQTGVNADGQMNRYAFHTDTILPTSTAIKGLFNTKYGTSYSDSGSGNYMFGYMIWNTIDPDVYASNPDAYEEVSYQGNTAYIGGINKFNDYDGNDNQSSARAGSSHVTLPVPFYYTVNGSSQNTYDAGRVDDKNFRMVKAYVDNNGWVDDAYDPNSSNGTSFPNHGTRWAKISNGNVVLSVVEWTQFNISTSGDWRHNIEKFYHIIIPKVHWGENHIFFPDNTFPAFDTLVGLPAEVTYTNESNASTTFSETIAGNSRNVLTLAPGGNNEISTDLSDASRRTTSSYTFGSNDKAVMGYQNVSVVVDGEVDYTWNTSTKKATISITDRGFIDGSLPTNHFDTKFKSRWKYSEQHGGRMFVANVILDPDEENERYADMILYSEAGMFGMIPIGNYIRVRDPQGGQITGIKSLGDSLCVLMEYGIYRLRVPSVNPSTFSILESNEYIGCIAPNSVVRVKDDLYFCGNQNIYRVDGMFNVSAIGSVIEDKYREEDNKSDTIAEYDPIKGCIIFRFGRLKHTLYEYNLERDEWNSIVMEKPVSELGLGITNHIYTIDNSSLTATREDNAHFPSETPPEDNPDGTNHISASNLEVTTGNYWSAIIPSGTSWGTVISEDPVVMKDYGEEDIVTPPITPGDQPTTTTYRKFKVFKQTTTTNFRFGNWSDGTSVYLPVKNESNPLGNKWTWFYWRKSVGDPITQQVFGVVVDIMDIDQHETHALVSIGLTNADVVIDSNGSFFYNGERDIVTSEDDGVDDSVPAIDFHNPPVFIQALKTTGLNKWRDTNNNTIQYHTSGVSQYQYSVRDSSFKILDGSPVNPDYQHGWCVKDDIASNYIFLLPENDNSSVGWLSETMIANFEANNIDYQQPMITGTCWLPVWWDGTTYNESITSAPTQASEIVFSKVDWERTQSQDADFKIGVAQQNVTDYNSGDFNSWLNDDSLAFYEKLICIKANSYNTRGYWNPHYPNPFSNATPVHYVLWYDILRAKRFKDIVWESV